MWSMVLDREISFPRRGSCFLFGPRQTGKTTLVRSRLAPHDLFVNLLPEQTYFAYLREPGRFRSEVLAHIRKFPNARCVVDEVQKLPGILDEVHDLIESHHLDFTLTGSSARKLRRGGANLLAGRAATLTLFPLLWTELGENFDFERALLWGLLPKVAAGPLDAQEAAAFLGAYAGTYLREEVLQEGLVRRAAPFVRFLDVAAENNAQLVNFTAVGRDCGVSVKSVQQYYEILEDTFLATRLEPWGKSLRKRLVAAPRYYFFDTGVVRALTRRLGVPLGAEERGRYFEAWLFNQMRGRLAYTGAGVELYFWRTHEGQEVDFLACRNGQPVAAIECKTELRGRKDFLGLRAVREDYPGLPAYIVTAERSVAEGGTARPRLNDDGIHVVPWRIFLEEIIPTL
jgi:predicted AAA+ superfamily ATPase